MEFNTTTFVLEIINFLVLVWILKRFLYKPVLDVITQRRDFIEKSLANSRQLEQEASSAKKQYENRLTAWEQESSQARDALVTEINQARQNKLKELDVTIDNERKKAAVQNKKEQEKVFREIELRALQMAAQFGSDLLAATAGPDLENNLIELFISESSRFSTDQLNALRQHWGTPRGIVKISSAYPIAEQQRPRLEKTLSSILSETPVIEFQQNADLLAGLEIKLGAWILGINIRDELKGFAEFRHVK